MMSIASHNVHYVAFLCSGAEDLAQTVKDAELGLPGDHGVDPGRIDGGVTQEIREADDVLLPLVVSDGEEVAEVVGENLAARDSRGRSEGLHPAEDGAPVQGPAGARDEDGTSGDALLPAVGAELAAEGRIEEDRADLSLEKDGGAPRGKGRGRNEGKLADADSCPGQGLHDECQLAAHFLSPSDPFLRGTDETAVVLEGDVPLRTAKSGTLGLEDRHQAFRHLHIFKEGVQRGEHGIGAAQPVLFPEILLVTQHDVMGDHSFGPVFHPSHKGSYISGVLVDGCRTFFTIPQQSRELQDPVLRKSKAVSCTAARIFFK